MFHFYTLTESKLITFVCSDKTFGFPALTDGVVSYHMVVNCSNIYILYHLGNYIIASTITIKCSELTSGESRSQY